MKSFAHWQRFPVANFTLNPSQQKYWDYCRNCVELYFFDETKKKKKKKLLSAPSSDSFDFKIHILANCLCLVTSDCTLGGVLKYGRSSLLHLYLFHLISPIHHLDEKVCNPITLAKSLNNRLFECKKKSTTIWFFQFISADWLFRRLPFKAAGTVLPGLGV